MAVALYILAQHARAVHSNPYRPNEGEGRVPLFRRLLRAFWR
jgi:hypothetical protein